MRGCVLVRGMRSIDVSMPLHIGMAAFPGDPAFESSPFRSIARGDGYNVSRIALGTHAGTHVDPPLHFLPGGASIDEVDLARLNGPCRVVRIADRCAAIGPAEVARIPRGTTRVLFRTRNSARWEASGEFFPDYVAVRPSGAAALVARGVRLVGVDSLSVENDPSGAFPVHHELLGHDVLIVEGLLLAKAPPGAYDMRCLPLRLRGGDGGPARVVLTPRRPVRPGRRAAGGRGSRRRSGRPPRTPGR